MIARRNITRKSTSPEPRQKYFESSLDCAAEAVDVIVRADHDWLASDALKSRIFGNFPRLQER
jgi:hypothetical protein